MRKSLFFIFFLFATLPLAAQRICIDDGWRFCFGHAADPALDFGCATEYFNYLTKANSIHNEGPYSKKFVENAGTDDAGNWREWQDVNLPHDWVAQLPFAPEASHSHGYKTVGWKYPATSVGWYRRWLVFGPEDADRQALLTFDGIFRDARVWANGFYCGCEPSGYISQTYDITDYISHKTLREGGSDSVLVCVRVDASLEEGWFYEGAGIYRHAWLEKRSRTAGRHMERLLDAEGNIVDQPEHMWSPESPYLYTKRTVYFGLDGRCDTVDVKCGFRKVEFDKDRGLFINGKHIKIKGACLHQDHAGVGAAIPDELYVWRVKKLKEFGFNAIRTSHNPASPALLNICDSLGMLVIEENRLLGTSDYHKHQLKSMIDRDRHHPSIIAWSMGNEEWGVEWNEYGEQIVRAMSDYAHTLDATRPTTVATSSGPEPIKGADIAGYNYIMQNPVEEHRRNYPDRIAYGSEETSGCGSRGVYFKDPADPTAMISLNRTPDDDGTLNRIARGWKFYDERPWLLGLFYWTGFDYRGEPNPLAYPASTSEFGIFDYCGFPKDEAYYLKAWWTDQPTLHLLPHWNLQGHEGETVDVWAYSNCDEVELFLNGKSQGRKKMERNSHLSWPVVYAPGTLKAMGYKNGKKTLVETVETTGATAAISAEAHRTQLSADGHDLAVVNISLKDAKGRFVADASPWLTFTVEGEGRILGAGNGDPSCHVLEQPADGNCREFAFPAFNGHAQVLVQTTKKSGTITLRCHGTDMEPCTVTMTTR